jgi:dTDP-4-amino-4,6-dideoxygalactose transaminase
MFMRVPLLDLAPTLVPQQAQLLAAMQRVLEHGAFIQGPEVRELEHAILTFVEARERGAVAVANGSDAIILALMAEGIGAGDEVIAPDFTFVSTATSIALTGATPVLVDIAPDSFALDIAAAVRALTPRTRAVIAVHLFGRAADVLTLREALDAAGRPDVIIIEDAAQALGARLQDRPVCSMGDYATISFFPSKNLGCFGDGGMVVARDPAKVLALRMLSQHGSRQKYFAELLGYNSRLDTLQAAILLQRLPLLATWCEQRRQNANRWRDLLHERGLHRVLQLPEADGEDGRYYHIYNQFTVRTPARDSLQQYLSEHEVGTAVYYPRPLSGQPCLQASARVPEPCVEAVRACQQVLSLPVYPGLQPEQLDYAADVIARWAEALPSV